MTPFSPDHAIADRSKVFRASTTLTSRNWRRWLLGGLLSLSACTQSGPVSSGGTGTPATAATPVDFVYDGQDHSWTDPAPAGVQALALGAGDNNLSGQPWTAANSGWGPIERDQSNGEKLSSDGRPLTIAGKTYTRGLGVHANSSVTFALGGQCSTFTAGIGLDDEVGDRGSVVFQIWSGSAASGTATKLYDSGTMRGADAAKTISVAVSGVQDLRLVVTDAGDGLDYDHADWGNPVVACGSESGVVRINAGGPAQTVDGVEWQACNAVTSCGGLVTGGFAYSESDTIAGVVAPANAALYQTEWTGGLTDGVPAGETAFEYKVPVANGKYQVRLHFAELNKTAAGQRVFDVKVEGQTVLNRFDIFAEAGGAGRALIKSLPSTVTDGVLNLAFVRQIENAKISALEIIPVPTTVGTVSSNLSELVFSTTRNATSAAQRVTLSNTGTAAVTITALTVAGQDAAAFGVVDAPVLPLTLAAGQNVNVGVRFAPLSSVGSLSASLQVASEGNAPTAVSLYGLSASGLQGDLEPPLQQVVNTLGYSINIGSSALLLGTGSNLIGDEVAAQLFRKAGTGPVTMKAVARYSPDDLLPFGYVVSGSTALNTVGTIATGQEQTLNPALTSGTLASFDPGDATFGLFAGRTSYAPQTTYTQDNLNMGPLKHAVRVYPLKNRAGQPVSNSYLVAMEPAVNGDYQDYVFVISNVRPQSATAVSWTQKADALKAVSEAQGAAVNGKLYIFGGFDSNLQTNSRVQAYDPATNTWSSARYIPEPITHGAVAVDGQTIYVAGGFVGNHPGPQTAHVWKYDVSTDTWSAGPNLPGARGGGALVRLGRTLHFFGGTERDVTNGDLYRRDSPEHWVLQLDGGTAWTAAAPLPNPRNHLAGAVLNGKIYALGGQHLGDEYGGNQSAVHMYDPATNTWTARASLPLAIGHINASTVVMNGRIVVISGVTQNSAEVSNISEYDPAANTWTALTPLPAPRQSPVADVINGQLVVATGALPSGAYATTWTGIRP
ncbi:NPCBM/NEW2 domain-containing protein [Deinococcus sp. QL22]|uniref:NPCBM/NEW2 domain-containing protein n=1 Tax=Deinococcus sp. QL22 TaxID=2939437 RepID=UPI002017199C|nr:NPCBM/NEW2 domain-containing protein [Deinococcus sp. QL22]UQN09750.1 NPCBM/NEW2 domain-containing protein [Deinococcus sp. QL22]